MVLRSSFKNKTNFGNCMCYSSSPHTVKKIMPGRFTKTLLSNWKKRKGFLTEQRLVSIEIGEPLSLIMSIIFPGLGLHFSPSLVSVKWNGTLSVESNYINISLCRRSYITISLCRPFMMVCRTRCCTHSVRAQCDESRVISLRYV